MKTIVTLGLAMILVGVMMGAETQPATQPASIPTDPALMRSEIIHLRARVKQLEAQLSAAKATTKKADVATTSTGFTDLLVGMTMEECVKMMGAKPAHIGAAEGADLYTWSIYEPAFVLPKNATKEQVEWAYKYRRGAPPQLLYTIEARFVDGKLSAWVKN